MLSIKSVHSAFIFLGLLAFFEVELRKAQSHNILCTVMYLFFLNQNIFDGTAQERRISQHDGRHMDTRALRTLPIIQALSDLVGLALHDSEEEGRPDGAQQNSQAAV